MSWSGQFGNEYIERNRKLTNFQYNNTNRLEVTKSFFQDIPRDASILELGCNVGSIIRILDGMGFTNVTGIDVNQKAINIIARKHYNYKFECTSIEDYEPGRTFDLVYTSGVLIHQDPRLLDVIVQKMERLSSKWIFGFEYYAPQFEKIDYPVPCYKGPYETLFHGKAERIEHHGSHIYYLYNSVS